MADAVAAAKADGATVALLTTPDMTAAHTPISPSACGARERPPPWGADVSSPI